MTLSVRLHHAFAALTLDIAFDAPPGVTVLFGRSGSGKTSVADAVAGLLRPQSGRIAIGDRVLCDTQKGIWVPPHRRRLGYIFQQPRLFPHLSVRQNLTYGARFAPPDSPGPTLDAVVAMLGIEALLPRRPGALSGGEAARVAIGRALLSHPALILADEPLASLDAPRKAEILPYFEQLRDHSPVPVLYVSHSVTEVARLATTVVVLENGRVVRQGPADAVLTDPQVTPLGAGEAGAMISATVRAHHDDGLSELSVGGLRLLVPRVSPAPGETLRLRIAAQDVMLATVRPEGVSALNIWPAVVTGIRLGEGPGALVQIEAGEARLLARITRRSVRALNLAEGTPVYAVLKAVSVARGGVPAR